MLIAIVVYQQIENYLFSPRITARTMELHPALAFGAALGRRGRARRCRGRARPAGGGDGPGPVSEWGDRHQVIKSELTEVRHHRVWKRWTKIRKARRVTACDTGVASCPSPSTTRSGVVESVHHGAVVALDRDGAVAWSVGDPDVAIYARSALKPLQAAAMVAAGLAARRPAAGRRLRQPRRAARARRRGRARSSPAPGSTPATSRTRRRCRSTPTPTHGRRPRAGVGPASILQNCSGKHAGMLATAVVNGWPTAGYTAPDHPVQRTIVDHLAGRRSGRSTTSASTAAARRRRRVSLLGLARAVRGLAVGGHAVHRAMTTYPEMVGGPTRDVTRLMRLVPGLLAKDGAEGVQVAALPDGRAVALKIADGGGRARAPVTVAALRVARRRPRRRRSLAEPILGHGEPVGVASVRSCGAP